MAELQRLSGPERARALARSWAAPLRAAVEAARGATPANARPTPVDQPS